MSKKQKQQKRLIKELESALAQTLSDWAIERQANRSLREVIVNDRQRHESIVDAMTNGMQRLRKERDAALADVAELLRDEEASTSCIRDLRRFVAQLQEERDELRLELAGMTSDVALDAALADVETLTEANVEADATIGELRDDLADTRERLDAALTEAARMRKEWAGDVTAAREVIERKTDENIKLRRDAADLRDELEALHANCGAQVANLEREMQTRQEHDAKTIGELRYEIAKLQAQAQVERDAEIQRLKNKWQHAEDLLQARERELDALRDQQAQQEHAEPVVTLEAIEELEEGEQLIDDNGVIIESIPGGYEVQGAIFHAFKATPVGALQYYHEITGK